MQKHLKGTLPRTCPHCRRPFEWVKTNFTRPDGYFDWRLDTFCPCGETRDPEIQKQAHEAYYRTLAQAIRDQQNAQLDKHLGPVLNRSLGFMARTLDPLP